MSNFDLWHSRRKWAICGLNKGLYCTCFPLNTFWANRRLFTKFEYRTCN
jgi:hypothetical protein